MSEPIIINFNYRERGSEQVKQINLEVISPEFYDNGVQANRIMSKLRDINDEFENRTRREGLKALKEFGLEYSSEFFDTLKLPENAKLAEEVLTIYYTGKTFNNEKIAAIYEALVDNLLLKEYKHLEIADWYNPTVPFEKIAAIFFEVWQSVFTESTLDSKPTSQEKKESEPKSEGTQKKLGRKAKNSRK